MSIYAGSINLNSEIGASEIGSAYVGNNCVYKKSPYAIKWTIGTQSNNSDIWLEIGEVQFISNIIVKGTFDASVMQVLHLPWKDYLNQIEHASVSIPDSKKVTNMNGWFSDCIILQDARFEGLTKSKITTLQNLFQNCYKLRWIFQLDDEVDFSEVTTIRNMCYNCVALESFEFPIGNAMAKLNDSRYAFDNCSSLTTIFSDEWDTTNLSQSTGMFTGCSALIGSAGTTYDSSHTDKTYARVDGGTSRPGYFTSYNTPYFINSDGEIITKLNVKKADEIDVYTNEECTFKISGSSFVLGQFSTNKKHIRIEGSGIFKVGTTGTVTATSESSGETATLNLVAVS